MQDKIIFLDFDGVITLPPYWNINVDKLKNLKKIVDATNAKT
jgi:histidinol phosphatase-like enzyme